MSRVCLALLVVAACGGGPLALNVDPADVEPWPAGVRVVEAISIVETPGESGNGPDREARLYVLDGSAADRRDEQLVGVVVDHLRARGWELSATFDLYPSFVGSSSESGSIVIVGLLSALREDETPLNSVGAAEVEARSIAGDGWVVAELVAGEK